VHNYLRMLWGKKVLEWSCTPEDAFATLVRLNDRWAVDGRDPNSYGGILWCFGKFDRPWGPVRPIFGSVRSMSCESAVRKLRMKEYLARHGVGTEAA
jgi:deoxyribodipyrimidine photo-lyase